eukprot:2951138-Pleurochrysis_carterae.AAC.3
MLCPRARVRRRWPSATRSASITRSRSASSPGSAGRYAARAISHAGFGKGGDPSWPFKIASHHTFSHTRSYYDF